MAGIVVCSGVEPHDDLSYMGFLMLRQDVERRGLLHGVRVYRVDESFLEYMGDRVIAFAFGDEYPIDVMTRFHKARVYRSYERYHKKRVSLYIRALRKLIDAYNEG